MRRKAQPKADPEATLPSMPEVVAPEVVAPEVVAPEVVAPEVVAPGILAASTFYPPILPAATAVPCVVCGSETRSDLTEQLCWVCRRLKISAWRDSEPMPAQE